MTQDHRPCLGTRMTDRIILSRTLSGVWKVDKENGEVISTRTGEPLRFNKRNGGYRATCVYYQGYKVTISKHRAVYIGGTCKTMDELPVDLNMHIDHINGNVEDCRLENLRLIPYWDNNHPKSGVSHRIFSDEQVEDIRQRYADGEFPRTLAAEFQVNKSTIHRIVSRKTYAEVGL